MSYLKPKVSIGMFLIGVCLFTVLFSILIVTIFSYVIENNSVQNQYYSQYNVDSYVSDIDYKSGIKIGLDEI